MANTLRFWEFYVSVGWQSQTLAFWVKPFITSINLTPLCSQVLTISPNIFEEELKEIPTWLTSVVGIFLICLGKYLKSGSNGQRVADVETHCVNIVNVDF